MKRSFEGLQKSERAIFEPQDAVCGPTREDSRAPEVRSRTSEARLIIAIFPVQRRSIFRPTTGFFRSNSSRNRTTTHNEPEIPVQGGTRHRLTWPKTAVPAHLSAITPIIALRGIRWEGFAAKQSMAPQGMTARLK
jgi:hypothetical protein